MVFHDAAGKAASEVLIEEGKLVPDFWLRVEGQRAAEPTWGANDTLKAEVSQAIRYAMGKAGVELPAWASPAVGAPDVVWVYPDDRTRFPSTEPYYAPAHMYHALKRCYDGSELTGRDEAKLLRGYQSMSWRSWRRLLPHLSPARSEQLALIEAEQGNNGNTFSKRYRIDHMLSGTMFRDGALHDLYVSQGDEGLKRILHGIGQKAVLGIGAMLFMSGEHDDLMHTAETLEDMLKS